MPGDVASLARLPRACPIAAVTFVIVLLLGMLWSSLDAPRASAQPLSRDQQLQEAARAHARGDVRRAIEIFSSVLSESGLPADRRALILNDRAVAHAQADEIELAFADFNESARLYPENAALYNNRASVLLKLGLADEALKDLERAIVLSPNYVVALANRAIAFKVLGRPIEALESLTNAVAVDEKASQALVARARLALEQGRPRAALRDIERGIVQDATNPLLYRLRAEANLAVGDIEPAIKDFSRALAFLGTDIELLAQRGFAYMRLGETAAAETDFTSVLDARPADVAILRERAHARILNDATAAAEADLVRALELVPRDPVSFAYRALLYKKLGRPGDGQREVQLAEQIDPKNPVVLWAKGETLEALGRTEAAVAAFRSALALDPALNGARLGLRRLAPDDAILADAVIAEGPEDWSVVRRAGTFLAVNPSLTMTGVPLEAVPNKVPRLLSWEPRDVAGRRFGVLVYDQGGFDVPAGDAPARSVALEAAVVLDLDARAVLIEVPARFGDSVAQWDWSASEIRIAAVDGLMDIVPLAAQRTAAGAAGTRAPRISERRTTTAASNRPPAWAPWADPRDVSPRQRSARPRQNRRPRTFFDLLLGN